MVSRFLCLSCLTLLPCLQSMPKLFVLELDELFILDEDGSQNPLIQRLESKRNDDQFNIIIKPCLAEFLATAIFVFIGTTSVQTGNGLLVALVHGMTIALLINCFGDISGAHINPAVTVAVYLGDHASQRLLVALAYVASQLVGSLAGAALNRAVLWFPPSSNKTNETIYELIAGGTHQLSPELNPGQGILIEVILTFILCQTVLHVAIDRKIPEAAMSIGLTVFVDIAIGANLTGASMNPARSFGPAVVISDLTRSPWKHHYVYWVGPLAGAVLAALSYRYLFSRKKTLFSRSSLQTGHDV